MVYSLNPSTRGVESQRTAVSSRSAWTRVCPNRTIQKNCMLYVWMSQSCSQVLNKAKR